jgi:signal transduction histidine kinase
VHRAADRIRRASARLVETIHGILDLSRMERGDFAIRPEIVDVAAVAEQSALAASGAAARKGLSLRTEAESAGVFAWIDAYCSRESLDRVIDNAVKFTSRGTVVIRVFQDAAGRSCVSVSDTGIGIDEAYRAKLFTPFSQQDAGSTRKFAGSGIGLALAKRYLEASGAELQIESEVGRGTVVTLCLPPREASG